MTGDRDRTRGGATSAVEVSLFCVSAAAGLGLVRLTTAPAASRVWWPVLASLSAGYVAVAVVRRVAPAVVSLGSGSLAVVLACSWLFVPRSTVVGAPTATTFHALAHLLDGAGGVIKGQATPLPPTDGVVLCLALGAGATAMLARLLLGRGRPRTATALLVCLVPPACAFVYASLLSSEVDRVQASMGFIAALVLYGWVVERPWMASDGPAGSRPARPARVGVAFALASAVAALLVPLAVSPALAGMQVDAVPFSGGNAVGPPGAAGSGARNLTSALDLIDNLRAVVVDRTNQTLLTARSPFPTYWQLATLSSFNGSQWTADRATLAAVSANAAVFGPFLPVLPAPPPNTTFDTSIQVVSLSSSLLAVPPNTSSVTGTSSAALVPSIGVYRVPPAPPGFSYEAVSAEGPSSLSAGGGSAPPASLAPYLALPRVAAAVSVLAHRIVRGLSSPAAQAAALVHYFANGSFHYSLAPPPSSSDPLSSFLFDTRTGFCQQFAGAYAVMARLVGLPTRLAVGFTPGTSDKHGGYRITGADAHVWPQVYLGPNLGWVSFEPTPSSGASSQAPGVFSGKSTFGLGATGNQAHGNAGQSSQPATNGSSPQGPSKSQSGSTRRTGERPAADQGRTAPRPVRHSPFPWGWTLLALLALAAAGGLGFSYWRRLFDAVRVRLLPPRAAVVANWERACRDLSRRRLGRRSAETVSEHARRVATQVSQAGVTYGELAGMAERAAYSLQPVSHIEAHRARQLRARMCKEMAPTARPAVDGGWSRS